MCDPRLFVHMKGMAGHGSMRVGLNLSRILSRSLRVLSPVLVSSVLVSSVLYSVRHGRACPGHPRTGGCTGDRPTPAGETPDLAWSGTGWRARLAVAGQPSHLSRTTGPGEVAAFSGSLVRVGVVAVPFPAAARNTACDVFVGEPGSGAEPAFAPPPFLPVG